jgi:hypothetical protein
MDTMLTFLGLTSDQFWTGVGLGAFVLIAGQIFVDAARPRRRS